MDFHIKVDGFADGGAIPRRLTCDGEDISPIVDWAGDPPGTKSFALIVEDPDAPGGVWNHWLLWDIPVSTRSLPEGMQPGSIGKSGTNDFGESRYGGPCPPRAKGPHRYFFRLFALNAPSLGLAAGAQRPALAKAMRKHTIAEAAYMGRYGRS